MWFCRSNPSADALFYLWIVNQSQQPTYSKRLSEHLEHGILRAQPLIASPAIGPPSEVVPEYSLAWLYPRKDHRPRHFAPKALPSRPLPAEMVGRGVVILVGLFRMRVSIHSSVLPKSWCNMSSASPHLLELGSCLSSGPSMPPLRLKQHPVKALLFGLVREAIGNCTGDGLACWSKGGTLDRCRLQSVTAMQEIRIAGGTASFDRPIPHKIRTSRLAFFCVAAFRQNRDA